MTSLYTHTRTGNSEIGHKHRTCRHVYFVSPLTHTHTPSPINGHIHLGRVKTANSHIMAYKRSGMDSYAGLIPYLHGVVKRRKYLQGFQRLKREKIICTSDEEQRHNKLILSKNGKQRIMIPVCGLLK